ncbi:hypothetical protein XENOCAPTIV_004800 [Xenoophorus captivus]|uniref:Uncharacterized protein n=1 Tax=Xenoophorus captivus TaxID=1517983 RepID=A0ABV0Q878_9TELE
MDLNAKNTSSQSLLSCGNGGERLKTKKHFAGSSCIIAAFCSFVSVLERLQSFLPQMADANEKLKQQMEEAPEGRFDIENVDEAERVIEMVSVT